MSDKPTIKDIVAKLIDNTPLALIVIGVFLFITGAAGGWPSLSLKINEPAWRIALAVMGAIVAGIGVILLPRGKILPPEPSSSPRQCFIELKDRSTFAGALQEVENAGKVDVLGLTLLGLVAHSGGCFQAMARDRSHKLRFLLVKPGSEAMGAAAGFEAERKDREDGIRTSIEHLKRLSNQGNVEIRFTSIAPPFSLVIIDSGKPEGKVRVELYGCDVAPSQRPHFELAPDNRPWYDFFIQQFENFWEKAQSLETMEQEEKKANDR